ncbi:hypothetical protein F5Y12DRAFT_443453 [Xylaria sp. FL1777]|nr:hypothetical protein F5Y12DRAFT_443453 [Xylaria sp. FL1777]
MHLAQPPESFGDEFDSRPAIFQMASVNPSAYDPLDDVFGPGPDSPVHGPGASATRGNSDMSLDTRRLRSQHNTVGYREGITAGKAASIQAGFDQGFSLGANIGIRAGQLLGLLEGISAALAEAGDSAHADALLSEAAAELNPESIFTSEFWAPDGDWVYPVTASHEGGEIVYPNVAEQHPLILKWSRIARAEADKWLVDQALPILEDIESHPRDGGDEDAALPDTSSKLEFTSRDAIEW